ncbi:MAG TPA: ribonuclease H-like domain-containing protein [Thermoplasmata archaeon]
MLRSTFQHLTGVGPQTEASLWQRGIDSWEEFRTMGAFTGLSGSRRQQLERELTASDRALRELDTGYFARRLPTSEHWRLYPDFAAKTAFLDIETTGLSPYAGIVTVVTVHGAGATRTFIADENLEELPAYLRRFGVLVTFNGLMFDVPFLQSRFPHLIVPEAHADLRFILRRLGYSGGLKRIEQVLQLGDREGVEGIHGLDAVRLWEAYRRGNADALDRLVRYNRADTVNLEPLLRFAVNEMEKRLHPTT